MKTSTTPKQRIHTIPLWLVSCDEGDLTTTSTKEAAEAYVRRFKRHTGIACTISPRESVVAADSRKAFNLYDVVTASGYVVSTGQRLRDCRATVTTWNEVIPQGGDRARIVLAWRAIPVGRKAVK